VTGVQTCALPIWTHPSTPKLVAGSGNGSAVVAKSLHKSEPCFLEALES
jgi:hypothetical protein